MRKLVLLACLVVGVAIQAQVKPKYEKTGDLVKFTSYYDNGTVKETGFYKNKKLTGVWKKYDQQGNKITLANYEAGKKVGKWFFWTKEGLKEVNFENNTIVSVQSWKEENSLAIN